MAKRDQDVHFLASKEEVERIHEKMDELGIRSMGAYLRKMALDGYCIRLDLQDVKAMTRNTWLHFLHRRLYDGGNEKTHEYVCSGNGQDARSW